MNKFYIILTLFALLLGWSCDKSDDPIDNPTKPIDNAKDSTYVVFLHMNDMHGHLDGFARMKFIADSLKEHHENVILLSGGDIFSGNPFVDRYDPKGHPMIDVMNRCGFRANVVGNHGFDYGQSILADRIKQANFPFLCANMQTGTALNGLIQDTVVIKTSTGKKIVVGGIIEVGHSGLPASHPDKLTDIQFTSAFEMQTQFGELFEDADMRVVLSHLGHGADKIFAEKNQQYNLIIGGHSHSLLDKPVSVGNVIVSQAGAKARHAGFEEFLIKEGKISFEKGGFYSLSSTLNCDKQLKSVIDTYKNNQRLTETIGYLKSSLDSKELVGYFMTDSWRSEMNTDMAFQNRGGIRLGMIDAGNLTRFLIYANDPFDNEMVTFNLTYTELVDFAIKNYDVIPSGVILDQTRNQKGYVVDVNLLDLNGKPLDKNRIYSVAANSYLVTRNPVDFTFKKHGITTAEATINYVKKKQEINYSNSERRFR